jgi:hypothetical protein
MFNLQKFADQVLPKDPNSDTKKLTEAIEKLNDTVATMQKEIEEIKPKEQDNPDVPVEPDTPGPKEVE